MMLLLFLLTIIQLKNGLAQNCLRPADQQGQIPFERNKNFPRLPNGTQAIITTYQFNCCGRIINWQTYVEHSGPAHRNGVYTITFQVWRPSPTVTNDGCYSLVGENRFSNIMLQRGGLVSEEASPSSMINVRPGDVVGYKAISNQEDDDGILLNDKFSEEIVWYHETPLPTTPGVSCPYPVGSQPDRILTSSTAAGPLLSISIVTSECQSLSTLMMSTPLPSSLMMSTSSPVPSGTPSPANPTVSTLFVPSSNESLGVVIIVVGVLTAIFLLIVTTMVVIIAIFQLRKKKKNVRVENALGVFYPVNSNEYNPAEFGRRESETRPQMSLNENNGDITYDNIDEHSARSSHGRMDDETIPKHRLSQTTKEEDVHSYSPPDFISSKNGDANSEQYTLIAADSDNPSPKENYYLLGPEYSVSKELSVEEDSSYSVVYASPTTEENGKDAIFGTAGVIVPNQRERQTSNEVYYNKNRGYDKLNFFVDDHIYWVPAASTSEIYNQLSSKKYREIPRDQIVILEHLGSGQFGTVSKGLWSISNNSLLLAIKQLPSGASSEERVKLLQEAAIMGQFSHRNVVKLYGLVTIKQPLLVCIEFMKSGDLKHFIENMNLSKDDTTDVQHFFLRAMRDIANGMKYLSKKLFVHRDLAARNILLNDSMTCKVGDFGMARDLMEDTYYTSQRGGKIPVKWTAPEALFYKKYSSDSDVWSYAMVAFEIWSMAKKPFSLMSNQEVMNALHKGYCQAPPPGCPRAIYRLMVDCWNPHHHYRPKFTEICNYLQQPVSKLLSWSQHDSSLSPSVRILGAPLDKAYKLYPDLQDKYIKKP